MSLPPSPGPPSPSPPYSTSSAGAEASGSSTPLSPSGPTPACLYACCEIRSVMPGSPGAWSLPEPTQEASTCTGLVVNFFALSAEQRTAVAEGGAHRAGQGLRHQRRVEHVLQGVDLAVLGVRVQRAVVVVLHGDASELLLRRAVALHVLPGEGGVEVHEHGALLAGALGRSRQLAALTVAFGRRHRRLHLRRPLHVHGGAGGGRRPPLVLVVELLEADGQGDVVHAGGDVQPGQGEGGGGAGAGVRRLEDR